MNRRLNFLKNFKQKDYDITLSLIKDNIVKISKNNKNFNQGNQIKDNIFINIIRNGPKKINNKIEHIIKIIITKKNFKKKITDFSLYIEKLLKMKKIDSLIIKSKFITNSLIINDSIAIIFIYIFKYLLNENKHSEIKKYIKLLISIISVNIFSIKYFTYILGLFLNIILDLIYINRQKFNSIKKLSINESPINFINDIIDGIISYPYEVSNGFELLESIIDIFNNFILNCQNRNIILENDINWLKLLKNKMVNPEKLSLQNNFENEKTVFNKLILFLIERFKYQIPKNFYYEIFKECAIDLQYYLNAVKFLHDIFEEEQKQRYNNKFKIKNGFYILNNIPITLSDKNFETNEFSLIFSFQILKIEKSNEGESIVLFNLYKKFKNILKVLVNKENKLQIIINNKESDTNVIINLEEYYLLCISQKKNDKMILYINTQKENKEQKIKICKIKTTFPEFGEEMNIELGKKNFRGIIGETFIINKIFTKENISYLFNTYEYYADLLYNSCKKVKYDLNSNYNSFYLSENESINFFKNEFEYECYIEIMTHKLSNFILDNSCIANTYLSKLYYSRNNINIYKLIYSIEIFINENGIDYLIFMLHNISTFITDINLFNSYLYYSLNLLYFIVKNNPYFFPNKIRNDKINNYNYLLKLNELFLTLVKILNDLKINNNLLLLNNDNKGILISFLDYFIFNKFLRNTIFSILLDNQLFDYKSNDNDIKKIFNYLLSIFDQNSKTKNIELINEEIVFKILSFDYILETNKNKNKFEVYYKLIGYCFICAKINIFKEMILYISNIENEIKLYHYLEFIYLNINNYKTKLQKNLDFQEYLKAELKKIKSDHCKYCAYTQIICYLLKNEIFANINELEYNINSDYNTFDCLKKPSFYMVKCIFIKNFNMDNVVKLKFIKSKDDCDIEILQSQTNNFFELTEFKKFIPRFTAFINYLSFLKEDYNLTKDKELLEIIEKSIFFTLKIIDLILKNDKVIYTDANKELYKNIIESFNKCDSLIIFFDLFLDFDKNSSFQKISEYVKETIDQINEPFYFCYLKNKSNIERVRGIDNKLVKTNIIKFIIIEITYTEEKTLNDEAIKNIIIFLILLYGNIINAYIDINQELSRFIVSFIYFLMNKDFYYIRYLFDVNINENKIVKKFIYEMIVDILINLSLNQKNEMEYLKIIESCLYDKEILSYSIFYNLDVEKKEVDYNFVLDEIKGSQKMNNFSFSIYYFVYFIIKKIEIKNQNTLKSLQKIINVIFKNLIQIFSENYYKSFTKLEMDNLKGMNKTNIQLYNEVIKIFSSNYNKTTFNYDFVLDKISRIFFKKQKQRNKSNYIIYNVINNGNDILVDNKNSLYGIIEQTDINNHFDVKIYKNRFSYLRNNTEYSFLNLDDNLILNIKKNTSKSFEIKDISKIRKNFFTKNSKEKIEHINLINSYNIIPSLTESKKSISLNNSLESTTNIRSNTISNSKSIIENSPNNNIIQINNVNVEKIEKYNIKERLSKLSIPCFFYSNLNSYSKNYESTMLLFNPKEYFIWKNFAILFKDYIFNNKKFKLISKCFKIDYRKFTFENSGPNDEKYYLNYPTKVKNYITKEYLRPFLKPYLNFYKNKKITISHSYINQNLLTSKTYKEDNFYLIEFKRIIPYPIKEDNNNNLILCEKFCNKGNIFGYMIIKKEYMIFINDPQKDMRKTGNLKEKIDYIYSFDDVIEDKNKFTLIYFKEIKEMFLRRICFNYFAYEIFLRDNHAHLFNFFNEKTLNLFIDRLNLVFKEKRRLSVDDVCETILPKSVTSYSEHNNRKIEFKDEKKNIINLDTEIYQYNFDGKKIKIVNKPWKIFKKLDLHQKFAKNEISIFNYLLLVNKYSSRSYNNCNQYLIFPILICKTNNNTYEPRDLSKALCLNKEKPNLEYFKSNFETFGHYFNTNYSSFAIVLYFLQRLAPFTYCQIKFQSGKFDLPDRMFSSMTSFLHMLFVAEENRELVPEFFYDFEMYLNLNKNYFGNIQQSNIIVNNFNPNFNSSIIEFTIFYRQLLEKQNNISKWIDNIFGFNQYNDSINSLNAFPKYCYEEFNDLESLKNSGKPLQEIYKELCGIISYLNFGVIPTKLFTKPHPYRSESSQSKKMSSEDININENSVFQEIISYISMNSCDKFDLVLYDNNLAFIYNSHVYIFSLEKNSKDFNLPINNREIKIQPYRNSFTEIIPGFYCFVRYEDKIIRFMSENESYNYLWTCVTTAVEKYKSKKINEKYLSKIFIGDENGFLNLMEIEFETKNNDQNVISISNLVVKVVKSVKAHLNYIKGILFDKRLNIVLTWCNDGVIRISNAYSFTCLNMITLGKKYNIKEIKISNYNLIYVSCYNIIKNCYYIKCFTLNGIRVSKIKSYDKIINFYLGEKINIIFSNESIKTYNLYDLSEEQKTFTTEYYKKFKIIYGLYVYQSIFMGPMNLLIIYNNNSAEFQKIDSGFL